MYIAIITIYYWFESPLAHLHLFETYIFFYLLLLQNAYKIGRKRITLLFDIRIFSTLISTKKKIEKYKNRKLDCRFTLPTEKCFSKRISRDKQETNKQNKTKQKQKPQTQDHKTMSYTSFGHKRENFVRLQLFLGSHTFAKIIIRV